MDIMCKDFDGGDTSRCFRCAARKSEANTFCGEVFLTKVAKYVSAFLKANADTAPNLQGNMGAFMLWVDGVLSKESGALAKDVWHSGGMLLPPVILCIHAR